MEPAKIFTVDYYGEKIARRHNTDLYEILKTNKKTAVCRRGYNFYLAIGLVRDYNEDQDVIEIEFKFGPNPKRDITHIKLVVFPNQELPQDPNQWGLRIDRIDPKYVVLEIHIPANAPVGSWNTFISTSIKENSKNKEVPSEPLEPFYILFNPWCKEDAVYMDNKEERNEYILNDIGKIWLGTWWKPEGRYWNYSQFDEIALRTSVLLLDKSNLLPEERGNAVRVARAISAIVNSDDDTGLLVANWNGNYSDGTSPYLWPGSLPILEQYYNSGGKPVRYGLCWVFSAVIVTVCRALGIPCRPTTVYGNAVGSSNITRLYDAFGNVIEDNQSNEFLWNFHVWNDVWMSRSLMPETFGGWQVIDATPQRHSEGMMRCGPASVEAVRQGFTDYLYDTDFVFAKLNASIRNIVIDENSEVGEYEVPSSSYQAGRKILTKALGPITDKDDDYVDITTSFKSQTGIGETSKPPNGPANDVTCELVADTVPLGESLSLLIKVTNNSNSPRTIRYVIQGKSVFYTGKDASEIDRADETITIRPGRTMKPRLVIPAHKYLSKLVDQGLVKLYAFVGVKETDQRWTEVEDYFFTKPSMVINTGTAYYVGDNINVNVSFRNPLNEPLTNCCYMVDGPGVDIPGVATYPDVLPLEEVRFFVTLTAGWRTGLRSIVATFISKQLPQVSGAVTVNISSPSS